MPSDEADHNTTGDPRAVPWKTVCEVATKEAITKFISAESFPEDFDFSKFNGDPSKLPRGECEKLVNYWKVRIGEGKPPVKWEKIPERVRKTKKNRRKEVSPADEGLEEINLDHLDDITVGSIEEDSAEGGSKIAEPVNLGGKGQPGESTSVPKPKPNIFQKVSLLVSPASKLEY